ncbi:DNA-processing protein DprA [bacterium]|nr:DNA-processing protein DprA [bacterium]
MKNIESWLYLNAIQGLGPIKGKALLDRFGSPENIFKATDQELASVGGIGADLIEKIRNKEKWLDLKQEISLIEKLGIEIITFQDSDYPPLLKNISSFPLLLYVKGNFQEQDYKMPIAIVGTRKSTYYGNSITSELAGNLTQAGFTIVSGMARGIDTSAHQSALKQKGRTVAVLGSGLNFIYPRENKKLSEEIAQNGVLVSEFPMNTSPDRFNFPRRNRIISGLSLGVVVVEAGEKSGAIITANLALEQGRDVFAIPGKIDSKYTQGTHRLIQDGAKLVTRWTDITSELMPQIDWQTQEKTEEKPKIKLEEKENKIYNLLSSEPIQIEEIIKETKMSSSEALSVLLSLELKGIVKQLPGKFFAKTK